MYVNKNSHTEEIPANPVRESDHLNMYVNKNSKSCEIPAGDSDHLILYPFYHPPIKIAILCKSCEIPRKFGRSN